MSAEQSHAEVVRLCNIKNSKLYRATQLTVMERLEKKMKAHYEARGGNNLDDVAVIVPMLGATQTKRAQLKLDLKDELELVKLEQVVTIESDEE